MSARFAIFACALAFGLGETHHFGWNAVPMSDAELICDGITLVLGCMGLLVPRANAHNG